LILKEPFLGEKIKGKPSAQDTSRVYFLLPLLSGKQRNQLMIFHHM
jgi:hypothetical protein